MEMTSAKNRHPWCSSCNNQASSETRCDMQGVSGLAVNSVDQFREETHRNINILSSCCACTSCIQWGTLSLVVRDGLNVIMSAGRLCRGQLDTNVTHLAAVPRVARRFLRTCGTYDCNSRTWWLLRPWLGVNRASTKKKKGVAILNPQQQRYSVQHHGVLKLP